MKIRTGFVSNSSSSSFLVSFSHVPSSETELQEMLFGTETEMYNTVSEENHSPKLLAKIIFQDMTYDSQAKLNKSVNFSTEKDLDKYEKELFGKYGMTESMDYYDISNEQQSKFDAELVNLLKQKSLERIAKFGKKNPTGKLFVFEYGNDSCINEPHYRTRCNMEDIDLFDKLPFLKRDNH